MDHILQQVQVEIASLPKDVISLDSQQPGLQQAFQVVGIHRQQEQAGKFRIRGQFLDPFPGQLHLGPDDQVDFSLGQFLFRSHIFPIAGFQQQLHGCLGTVRFCDPPQLGGGQQMGGQDADPAQGIFITGLGHITSPPRQTGALPRGIPPRSVHLPAGLRRSRHNRRFLLR